MKGQSNAQAIEGRMVGIRNNVASEINAALKEKVKTPSR
jgi:hypothetical protein